MTFIHYHARFSFYIKKRPRSYETVKTALQLKLREPHKKYGYKVVENVSFEYWMDYKNKTLFYRSILKMESVIKYQVLLQYSRLF